MVYIGGCWFGWCLSSRGFCDCFIQMLYLFLPLWWVFYFASITKFFPWKKRVCESLNPQEEKCGNKNSQAFILWKPKLYLYLLMVWIINKSMKLTDCFLFRFIGKYTCSSFGQATCIYWLYEIRRSFLRTVSFTIIWFHWFDSEHLLNLNMICYQSIHNLLCWNLAGATDGMNQTGGSLATGKRMWFCISIVIN